jgi:hypothetical protein
VGSKVFESKFSIPGCVDETSFETMDALVVLEDVFAATNDIGS